MGKVRWALMGLGILFSLLFLPDCQRDLSIQGKPSSMGPSGLAFQQEASRQFLLGLRCRKCHDARLDTAIPGALKIFDLSQKAWDATMSPEEYASALRRIKKEESLGPQQIKIFEKYVGERRGEP